MRSLYIREREEKIKMYAVYFELWELYYMEKSYIDDFIYLYKKLRTTHLISQEMEYLKEDLKVIQSFPDVIELQLIRLDVSQIKGRI